MVSEGIRITILGDSDIVSSHHSKERDKYTNTKTVKMTAESATAAAGTSASSASEQPVDTAA